MVFFNLGEQPVEGPRAGNEWFKKEQESLGSSQVRGEGGEEMKLSIV